MLACMNRLYCSLETPSVWIRAIFLLHFDLSDAEIYYIIFTWTGNIVSHIKLVAIPT